MMNSRSQGLTLTFLLTTHISQAAGYMEATFGVLCKSQNTQKQHTYAIKLKCLKISTATVAERCHCLTKGQRTMS